MSGGTHTRFDAVIVGAGPAGSAAAILLARAGWVVALIERQRFPRRKVCGECLAASNLALLDVLGIAGDFDAEAGPELRRVTLMLRDDEVTADLPVNDHPRHRWGRALGRERLDTLLLEQARAAGAHLLQPWSVHQVVQGVAGTWQCEVRSLESATILHLNTAVLIDAHGSWEDLPVQRSSRRLARSAADLFAFKANFTGSLLDDGTISVLALDGGYGGMVVADGGLATLACCIRRDRLGPLRGAAPGQRAGDVVQAWLQRECSGVAAALQGASRQGHWLASGPIDPGVRIRSDDTMFRIGNAAGEAHPILGEGMSMALQSAALLCSHLLGKQASGAASMQALQRSYAADWRREFLPRLRLASVFAQAAMHPPRAALMMSLARRWPGLLTLGARWGGKVRLGTRSAQFGHPVPGRASTGMP